jgi:polyisoprenoid-binding protein YceI
MRIARLAGPTMVVLAIAACGGPASVAVDPTVAPASATPSAAVEYGTAAPAGETLNVSVKSKAVVSVREQLVSLSFPSDAVLTATGAKGTFALNADGTFAPGSKITFDLTTLSSDSRDRDSFVKQDTLATRQFPIATFVPTATTGLALPLPASGDFSFTLAGTLTIHGKDKAVTFDVKATRNGPDLSATATANPVLTFEDFGMSPPSVPFRVVSVVDQIHLVVSLVATGPTG